MDKEHVSDAGSIVINPHLVHQVVNSGFCDASLGWIFRIVGDIVNIKLFPVFFRMFLQFVL